MASTLRYLTKSTPRALPAFTRQYHASTALRFPYKDTQDRESLRPGSTEGTKTGRDDDVAAHSDAAFDPSKTRPEGEAETAEKGSNGNPLNASGANHEMSKPMGNGEQATNTGAGKEVNKGGASGGGSAPKKGSPKKV